MEVICKDLNLVQLDTFKMKQPQCHRRQDIYMSGWNVCLSATIPCRLEMVGGLTNKALQSRV